MNVISSFERIPVSELLEENNGKFTIGNRTVTLTKRNLIGAIEDFKIMFPYTAPSLNTMYKLIRSNICHVCGEYKGFHQAPLGQYPSQCPHFDLVMMKYLNIKNSYIQLLEEYSTITKLSANRIHISILNGKGYSSKYDKKKEWSIDVFDKWILSRLCKHCLRYHLESKEWCRECSSCQKFHAVDYVCFVKRCSICHQSGHSYVKCQNIAALRKVASLAIKRN